MFNDLGQTDKVLFMPIQLVKTLLLTTTSIWFTTKKVRHGRSLLKKTCMSGSNMTVKRAVKNEVVFIFNML